MPTIVVVDDQRTSRNILARLAATTGDDIEVKSFSHPVAALEWAGDNIPDLVVTDYKMPQMDGAEFIAGFRKIPACGDVPVVVVTVYEDQEFRYRALRMGATDFLLSPVDHDEFRARCQNLLVMRQHQKETLTRAQSLERQMATKDRHFARAMRESREQLEGVIDAVPALIGVTDRDSRIHFLNRHHEVVFAIKTAEAVGRRLGEITGPEQALRAVSADQKVFRTGTTVEYEQTLVDRQGAERIFFTTKSPLCGPDGEVVKVVSVSLDITELKKAENDMRAAKEEAERANHTKTEFLAHMSHELRTPLNAIVGFSEIMMGEMFGSLGNEKYCEYAKDINNSGTHLLDIINDILDLSVAEIGKLELQENDVAVSEALHGCIRMMRDQAQGAGVVLTEMLPSTLPNLYADGRKVRQIVINLLSNAIKFTPAGGRVTLSAQIDANGRYCIKVADTGIGIARESMAQVLAPFRQVESALSRKHQGAGLGLPLSKRLAELHGGTLEVESVEGEGTTVTVIFPAARILAKEATLSGTRPGTKKDKEDPSPASKSGAFKRPQPAFARGEEK